MRIALTVAVAIAAAPGFAHEDHERDFPAERFEAGVDKESILNTSWASVPEHLALDVGLTLQYENDPLFTYPVIAGTTPLDRLEPLVENRLTTHITGSIALFEWIQLGIEVPVLIFQQRDETRAPAFEGGETLGTSGIGDIRFYPKARIIRQRDGSPLDIGFQIPVSIPTGQYGDYFGEEGFTFTPTVLASREWALYGGTLRAAGNLGTRFRSQDVAFPKDDPQNVASTELLVRAGLGYVFELQDEQPTEVALSLASASEILGFFEEVPLRNPSEVLGEVNHNIWGPIDVFLGGAVGLVAGEGGPDFRVFTGVRFAPRAVADTDGDGIADKDDKCIKEPETQNGLEDTDGCPDTDDKDGDGVKDADDKCPNVAGPADNNGCPVDEDPDHDGIKGDADKCPKEAEDKDGFKDKDGCPELDNDKDGVLDADDKCPRKAEDKDGFEDADGCPELDNDGDGIRDRADKCPLEAGVKEMRGCPDPDRDGDTVVDRLDNCPDEKGDPANNGCAVKQLVVIRAEKLEILDKVFFKTGKDVIESKSFPLLDNVAAVVKSHPEITKLRVEGHTDSDGVAEKNKDLSDRRAKAVVMYLTDKGVDASRLDGVGFGQEKPVADNATDDGKAQNRRVEFVIVQDPSTVTPDVPDEPEPQDVPDDE